MNDAVACHKIVCVARHLLASHKHVIVLGRGGGDAQLSQHGGDHGHIAVECEAYMLRMGDITHHHITHISIYTSASTLAPEELNAVLTTILQVDFNFNVLVPSENDAGLYLPKEETVIIQIQITCNVLFCG